MKLEFNEIEDPIHDISLLERVADKSARRVAIEGLNLNYYPKSISNYMYDALDDKFFGF